MEVGRSQTDVGEFTSRAYERLRSGEPGDTITREQMSAVVGRDVEPASEGYNNVRSAIMKCEREESIVWEWRRDLQAWLCLDDHQQRDSVVRRRKRHRRELRRTSHRIDIIDTSKLNPEERSSLQTTAIQVGMAKLALSKPMAHKIDQMENKTLRLPDIKALAGLLGGG